MKGYLALADGTVLNGQAFGAVGTRCGEVIFNTGMADYQDVVSDPAYCQQIVVMTYPLLGNFGIYSADQPTECVRGLVVKEFYSTPNHWRCQQTLEEYMKQHNIIGLAGIDTRYLTRLLREKGTLRGVIAAETEGTAYSRQQLVQLAQVGAAEEKDPVLDTTCRKAYSLEGRGPKVAVLDLGSAQTAVQQLQQLDCAVVVLPAYSSAEAIAALLPDGLLLSGGPGSPAQLDYIVRAIKKLMAKYEQQKVQLPLFGVGLGHNVLAQIMGAGNQRLKYGHHGCNQPVQNLASGHVCITVQNHDFAVVPESLEGLAVSITRRNINDQTIEGLKYLQYPAFSVQYQPQVIPGSPDSEELYQEFVQMMQRNC